MGAMPEGTNRCIAIMAQDTEAQWEIVSFKPDIEFCPAVDLNMLPVLHSTTVDMVNAKKFCKGFPATGTFVPIMFKDFLFDFRLAGSIVSEYSVFIKLIIKMSLSQIFFPMCLTPRTSTGKAFIFMIAAVAAIIFSLNWRRHYQSPNLLYHKAWDGKTIFGK